MNKNLFILAILLAMALVYTICFTIFAAKRTNLSRENPNRKFTNFWAILSFCLGYACFVLGILLVTFLM